MNNSLITTVKLCTACIFTVNSSELAAQRRSQVKWLTPVKPEKNACLASALFQCSPGLTPPTLVKRPPKAAADHQFVGAQLYYSLLKLVVLVRWLRWERRRTSTSHSCTLETVCSCAIQYSQVRPRFVAALALRASLARCAGKSSVQTRCRYVQLLARPITSVPRGSLCASVRCLSKAASSIRYSASLGGSAMPAQHTRSTGLLCGRPVALELSTRQLEIRILTGTTLDVCWRGIYFQCTEAFSVLEMFQDDTLYKLTYLLTYLIS